MKTYDTKKIDEILTSSMKKLQKKFDNKLEFLKIIWEETKPNWANDTKMISLKNKILTMQSKENGLILKYKEKELIKLIEPIIGVDQIKKIKIIAK